MAYDPSKDIKVAEYDTTQEDESGGDQNRIYVEVYRYNGGQPKVQVQRMLGEKHVKLGRLSLKEIKNLIPVMQQLLLDHIDE